jgi:hypothetical protein
MHELHARVLCAEVAAAQGNTPGRQTLADLAADVGTLGIVPLAKRLAALQARA